MAQNHILTGDEARYLNSNDAWMRLGHTYVQFEGKPIYIWEPGAGLNLHYTVCGEQEMKQLNANDERLDISSLPLGFLNLEKSALYASRTCARQQQQGIQPERVRYFDPRTGEFRAVQPDKHVHSAYHQMFSEAYPKLKDTDRGAFSRTWAVHDTPDPSVRVLYHKATAIGFYVPKERLFLCVGERLSKFRKRSLERVLAKQFKPGESYDVIEHK